MSLQIGIGFSDDVNIEKAAQDAAFQSKTNLGVDRIDLAIIFSTIHYDPTKTLPIFHKILHRAKIVGNSTAGIILSNSIETRGIAVLTLSSDSDSFGIGAINGITKQNAGDTGASLANNCLSSFGENIRQLFLVFFDGNVENIPTFIQGAQDIFGNIFPFAGGGSCDDFHFSNTFQLFQNKILKNSAVGIIFGGHTNIGIGSNHGWKALGKPRIVDKSDGNVIRSIDGEKATNLYEEFFGENFKTMDISRFGRAAILYPFGIFIEGSKEPLLRSATEILADGSIVCQGNVPEGSEIHIMIGNKDSCRKAAFEASQEAKNNLIGKKAKMILVIESMARLKLLGKTALQEVGEIKKVFGRNIPIMGMYSNGEISPLQSSSEGNKLSLLHSESIVILAIG